MASFEAIEHRHAQVVIYQDEAKRLSPQPQFAFVDERNREQRKMWVDVLNQGIEEGYFRPDLDVDLVYRFIRDTTWVSVRWYQPGGPLTAEQVGSQYLAIVLGGITKSKETRDMAARGVRHRRGAYRCRQAQRSLAGVHPVDLGAAAWRGLFDRVDVDPGAVDDVIAGCVDAIGGQAGNIARLSWLAAGYPEEVPGVTVDRQCGSSQQAISFGAQAIMSGTADLIVAGGMQNMSQIPICVGDDRRRAVRLHLADQRVEELAAPLRRPGDLAVPRLGADRREVGPVPRGDGAVLADAATSVRCAAIRAGHFENEIIAGRDGFRVDEGPRETSLEKMAGLKTLVEGGRLTAAMASQISDGASAVLLASEQAVKDHGLTPRARIHHISARGADPVFMLTGPIPATQYALEKTGPVDRRHRHRRDQRGVRAGRDGVAQGDQGRPGEGQPQRRRDRARAPARRHRRQAVHHHAEHAGAHRRSLRPADDVRGRRHRQRHHHRTALISRNCIPPNLAA